MPWTEDGYTQDDGMVTTDDLHERYGDNGPDDEDIAAEIEAQERMHREDHPELYGDYQPHDDEGEYDPGLVEEERYRTSGRLIG